MSGRITTPTCAGSAGSATAAEKSVPSAAVSVRTPRSPTSPLRGGAGGRLSWSWHTAGSAVRGRIGGARVAAEDLRRDLPPGVGQPLVLLVGLGDQPAQERGVQPGLGLCEGAQRLEPGPLGEHRGGDELELDEVAERRAGEQVAVQLRPGQLLADPGRELLVLADRNAQTRHGAAQRGPLLAQL